MFEEEAEEIANKLVEKGCVAIEEYRARQNIKYAFKKGSELGYSKGLAKKANEWHYIINDFPKEEGTYLVCRKYHNKKYLQLLEFDGSYWVTRIKDDPENFIIAWKKESLPK